jgi:hypothetical protein
MDSSILPRVTEEAMSIFLREASDRHPDEFFLMVMDGAGWYKANALMVPDNMLDATQYNIVRASIDRDAPANELKPKPDRKIVIGPVGGVPQKIRVQVHLNCP